MKPTDKEAQAQLDHARASDRRFKARRELAQAQFRCGLELGAAILDAGVNPHGLKAALAELQKQFDNDVLLDALRDRFLGAAAEQFEKEAQAQRKHAVKESAAAICHNCGYTEIPLTASEHEWSSDMDYPVRVTDPDQLEMFTAGSHRNCPVCPDGVLALFSTGTTP